jgi:uncharacterized protein (TIGR03790 family)
VAGGAAARWAALAVALVAWSAASPPDASAQTAANLLLVVNENSPESVAIGEHYAKVRSVPREHIVLVKASPKETVSYADYAQAIESPIAEKLTRASLQDRILYIVLTKGVPIRIAGTGGLRGTVSSVDSELTLLYRKLVGHSIALAGREPNPYFLGDKPIAEARRFSRLTSEIYLVTRLDGYSVEDVVKLIDRGVQPAQTGQFVLDQRRHLLDRGGGDRWLADAAARLEPAAPGRVLLENTRELAKTDRPVLGYYSWGSNDDSNRRRGAGLTFAPGALAGMFVSTDGRTFVEPPADWVPGPSNRPAGMFGSGSQSLAADLIREGATGVSAHVDEPYLDATVRPHILFPAYLAGFNLVESFYLATPFLSWRNLVIGDPLCAPFRDAPLPPGGVDEGVDPETELPALFAERRVALMTLTGWDRKAVQIFLRAGARILAGDKPTGETLLRQARDLEPRLVPASLQLASLYEARDDHDSAIGEYRRIVAADARHAIALNNLAYSLAVHKKSPAEALPYADQAFNVARQPFIADTLGWIHHLLGNDLAASPLIELAATSLPDNAEVQLHAAILRAARGDLAKADVALRAALKLDAQLAERADVKELRRRIDGGR